MILHETVRNYFNIELLPGEQKLASDEIDAVRAREIPATAKRAHREENTGGAKVDLVRKARWSAMRHAAGTANIDPNRSAKASRYGRGVLAAKASRDGRGVLARLKPRATGVVCSRG
jgi:hypothetical protein